MSTDAPEWVLRHAPDPLLDGLAFLVYSNLFVATAATCVALTTTLLADLQPEPLPLFIVFGAAMFVYSVDRVADVESDERTAPRRASFLRSRGWLWLALGIGLYLAGVGTAAVLSVPYAELLAIPVGVVFAYSLAGAKRLLLLKNLLVGLSWALIPLGVGVYYGALRSAEVLSLAGVVFATVTAAAALFDVRDLQSDRVEGVRTVPLVVGPRRTRIGAAVTTVGVAVCVVAAVGLDVLPASFLLLLAYLGYVLAYVPFATPERGSLFYGFVIDGEHVFLAAVVVAAELL